MNYTEWAARWPNAAAELQDLLNAPSPQGPVPALSEAATQQTVRFKVAKAGARAWRNNVGATPSKCKDCGAPQQPIRYGLANDSEKLNRKIKSSDLILAIPRTITPHMVGQVIAQFGAVECKRAGWHYTGTGQEPGQAAWLALVASLGGVAQFSTGEIDI